MNGLWHHCDLSIEQHRDRCKTATEFGGVITDRNVRADHSSEWVYLLDTSLQIIMKYFLSTLILTWTTFQFARSDWVEKSFRRYQLQPDGCQDLVEPSELVCALRCSATTDCVAFSYDSMAQLCSKCFQSQVTSVSVNKKMFWLRNSPLFDVMPHSYVTGDHKILVCGVHFLAFYVINLY